jgi:hypothetical protein
MDSLDIRIRCAPLVLVARVLSSIYNDYHYIGNRYIRNQGAR